MALPLLSAIRLSDEGSTPFERTLWYVKDVYRPDDVTTLAVSLADFTEGRNVSSDRVVMTPEFAFLVAYGVGYAQQGVEVYKCPYAAGYPELIYSQPSALYAVKPRVWSTPVGMVVEVRVPTPSTDSTPTEYIFLGADGSFSTVTNDRGPWDTGFAYPPVYLGLEAVAYVGSGQLQFIVDDRQVGPEDVLRMLPPVSVASLATPLALGAANQQVFNYIGPSAPYPILVGGLADAGVGYEEVVTAVDGSARAYVTSNAGSGVQVVSSEWTVQSDEPTPAGRVVRLSNDASPQRVETTIDYNFALYPGSVVIQAPTQPRFWAMLVRAHEEP